MHWRLHLRTLDNGENPSMNSMAACPVPHPRRHAQTASLRSLGSPLWQHNSQGEVEDEAMLRTCPWEKHHQPSTSQHGPRLPVWLPPSSTLPCQEVVKIRLDVRPRDRWWTTSACSCRTCLMCPMWAVWTPGQQKWGGSPATERNESKRRWRISLAVWAKAN